MKVEEINIEQLQKEFVDEKMEHKLNPHKLNKELQAKLKKVIDSFDTFDGTDCL